MTPSVDLWSEIEGAVVPFDVALIEEADEDKGQGTVHVQRVLMVSRGGEKHRFSPNTTDEELARRVDEMNREAQGG